MHGYPNKHLSPQPSGPEVSAFLRAASRGDNIVVAGFLDKYETDGNKYAQMVLLDAVRSGHVHTVSLLTDRGADIHTKDSGGCTPLIWATVYRHQSLITWLLEKGVDGDERGNNGLTALMFALRNGYLDIVTLLLDKGADMNLRDGSGNTALMWAEEANAKELAALLRRWPEARQREKEKKQADSRIEKLKQQRPARPALKKRF